MNRKNIPFIVCFALSAILLTVIGAPFNLSFLAWVALVPFVIGSLVDEKNPLILGVAYIVGFFYWLGNLYWLAPVTIPGWVVVCLYLGLYWPIVAVALRYCVRRKVAIWFALPILIVGEETLRGWLFGSRFLAHSQYQNIHIIQIADIFGTAGISFLIAMVNGVISETILGVRNSFYKKSAFAGGVITGVCLIAVFFYGRYRIDETAKFIRTGPSIGVVQSNVPIEAGSDTDPAEKTFLSQLAESRICLLDGKPSFIIWPESMVETIMDDSLLELVSENDIAQICHKALLRHSNEGVDILIGAFAGDAYVDGNRILFKTKYNTAFLYEPNQIGPRQKYNKIHLVPFGEYMPLKKQMPFLFKLLMMLTPYDYDYTLDAGDEYKIFKMPMNGETYRFGVMICFEDTIPHLGRKLAIDENGNKRADWLVNITNDGWFVRKSGEKIKASTELSQHMAICVFRAVENRLSVIRCANTGISCVIDSVGNIKNDYISGTLDKRAVKRAGRQGWFVDRVTIDKRITAFSKHGQLLGISCAICLIVCLIANLLSLRHNGKRAHI